MGLPALYYSGRNNLPHPEIWINYFHRMAALYSVRVSSLTSNSSDEGFKIALSHLKSREIDFLRFLTGNRLYEFTPIEVSRILGVTNKTISSAQMYTGSLLQTSQGKCRPEFSPAARRVSSILPQTPAAVHIRRILLPART